MKVETGVLHEHFPYVRIGAGGQPLVVLPGLSLDNKTASGLVAWSYGQGFRRLAAEFTLYIVQRRRGRPDVAETKQLAADYAQVLSSQQLGHVKLMGLSTGGLIAQHIALNHPELVDRLVLVVSGAYLSKRGREMCLRWRELAQNEQWRALRGELAAAAVDGAGAQRMARTFGSVFGKAPTQTDVADFVATVDADLAHDTTAELSRLDMPAIVIGGADDPFFPEPVLRETAALIPQAELHVYSQTGHGLPKRHGKRLQEDVLKFLRASGSG